MSISKIQALKKYFSTPEYPVTNTELIRLAKEDIKGYNELAKSAAKELGETLSEE